MTTTDDPTYRSAIDSVHALANELAELIDAVREAAVATRASREMLETLTGMDAAQRLYEHVGFKRITAAMGNTGHFGCNRFYLLDL